MKALSGEGWAMMMLDNATRKLADLLNVRRRVNTDYLPVLLPKGTQILCKGARCTATRLSFPASLGTAGSSGAITIPFVNAILVRTERA